MIDEKDKCPCCSGESFASCCQAVIKNVSARTALALMRSRYTAYSIGNVQYLTETTHLTTREKHTVEGTEKWLKRNRWVKLEIVDVVEGETENTEGIVEFKAFYIDSSENRNVLHERSSFINDHGKWYYVDGVFSPSAKSQKTSRNEPCLCGSGVKYKKCCGK